MSKTRNIFQKMSSEIADLKAEIAELKLEKGCKDEVSRQRQEIDDLTSTNVQLVEEVSSLKMEISRLRDLNEELLNTLTTQNR